MNHSPLIILALVVASTARADDWLAVLPECVGERAPVGAELLYPRDGLPALVPAGELLVVRARLPLPLTPPPGVQQPRALEGLEAALIGHAIDLRAEPREQRWKLEVVNVRPEGPSSLRYRLAVPVPAWLAPGTYDFELSAKGASLRAASSVRVLAQGARPRLVQLDDIHMREYIAMLTAPVDAFVDPSAAIGRDASLPRADAPSLLRALQAAAPPVLRTAGLHAALRVGDQLAVIGGCEAQHLPFDVEIESVLRSERRKRAAHLDAPIDGIMGGSYEVEDDFLDPVGDGWLRGRGYPLQLLVPVSARLPAFRAQHGTLRVHPAAEPGPTPDALIVQWSGGGRALARVAASPLRATLQVQPNPVASGEPVRASVRANRPLAAVALRFDHLHTSYGLQPVEHRYRALGTHRIAGLAIGADGTVAAVHADVTVRTARASDGLGCALHRPIGSQPVWASQGLWLGVLLLKRRGRRAAGNRLGADPRSA